MKIQVKIESLILEESLRFYNTIKGHFLTFSEKQQREMAKFKVVLLLHGHMTVNFALLFGAPVTSYRDIIAQSHKLNKLRKHTSLIQLSSTDMTAQ